MFVHAMQKYNLSRIRRTWFSIPSINHNNSFYLVRYGDFEFRLSLFYIGPIRFCQLHNGDVIMGAITSQITSLTIVYSTAYSYAEKHQISASQAFVQGIHRGPVNSPHKWPVTRKMFPFDDVIMFYRMFTFFIMSSLWYYRCYLVLRAASMEIN